MTALVMAWFICVVVLVMVALAGLLQYAEKRSPRFSRWLDRVIPENEGWKQW